MLLVYAGSRVESDVWVCRCLGVLRCKCPWSMGCTCNNERAHTGSSVHSRSQLQYHSRNNLHRIALRSHCGGHSKKVNGLLPYVTDIKYRTGQEYVTLPSYAPGHCAPSHTRAGAGSGSVPSAAAAVACMSSGALSKCVAEGCIHGYSADRTYTCARYGSDNRPDSHIALDIPRTSDI